MILDSQNKEGPIILISTDVSYVFPTGYAYLMGALKEQGHEVKLFYKPPGNWRNNSFRKLANEVMAEKPLLVGMGSLYPEIPENKIIVDELNKRNRDFPIVIGGQMVTPIPEFAMKITGADYGILGEGEIILCDLVNRLKHGKDATDIKGLIINTKDRLINNGPGPYPDIHNLPDIPYELLPAEKWLHIGRFYDDGSGRHPHWKYDDRVINVHGGRGCPFTCNFCYHHSKPRYRKVKDIIEEAQELLIRFDANMLYFGDDLVLTSPVRAQELIDEVSKLDRKVSMSVSTRFDILDTLSNDIIRDLKKAGVRMMGLGAESGSDRILQIIGKNTTKEAMLYNLRRLKDADIKVTMSVMVGQESETWEDVLQTLDFLRKSYKYDGLMACAVCQTTPFPGSELYDLAKKKKRWGDKDMYDEYVYANAGMTWVVNMTKMSDNEVKYGCDTLSNAVKLFKKW